ncbi:MAG: DNA-3-methyladenine glycosylase [Intestinimonas sp.]|jgi:DNA-3-methyladenine glycosylase|nr:DNA-3-methyladenine glycosylase [Intestinimonas sp.]
MARLTRDFFDRDTVTAARELLGKYLLRRTEEGLMAGRITETEAYVGRMDKACHAYGYKRTARTETLFAQPGTAYLYLIYGMYHCLNFVTEPEGQPSAVLLRGLEPAEGAEQMARNRFGYGLFQMTAYQKKNFLNGPGKICQALDLTRAQNGLDLTVSQELFLWDAGERPDAIHTGKRIGIDYAEEAVEFPWRFWL